MYTHDTGEQVVVVLYYVIVFLTVLHHLLRSLLERRNINMLTVAGFKLFRFFETVLPLSEKLFSNMELPAGTARIDRAAQVRIGQVKVFDFHHSKSSVPELF